VNFDLSLVVTITVTCYLQAPSTGDYLITCCAISRPPQWTTLSRTSLVRSLASW